MASTAALKKGQVRLVDVRGQWIPEPGWPAERTAPEQLERVRRLLNTVNPHSDADLLGSVAELKTWVRTEGFACQSRMDAHELGGVLELRRILRALTVCNVEGKFSDALWAELTTVASRFPVCLTFDSTDRLLSVGPSEIAIYVADVLQTVFFTKADGTWRSLKACSDETCRWVVFDQTKNQSVEWCSAGTCGGKARARAYRARKREQVQ